MSAKVPNLIGLTVRDARNEGHEHGIVVTGTDIDGPPLGALTWPGLWVVTGQDPAPGQEVPRGAPVRITYVEHGDDGSAGVREPRKPLPKPQSQRAVKPGMDVDPIPPAKR